MLNWFDIVVVILLIIGFINGFKRGLIMQIVGFGAIILGVVFGGKFAKIILPQLIKYIDVAPQTASVIAYILAFSLIVLAVGLIGKILQNIFEVTNLNFINRILGSILSLATVMIILSVLLNLVLTIDQNETIINSELKQKSFFYERVQTVIPAIVPYLNEDVWKKYIPEEYRRQHETHPSTHEKSTVITQYI